MTQQRHIVIVGAGFGGLRAARALKHADVRITVIDRRNYHLFQPLLYEVATAGLSPNDIAYPIRAVLRRQKNTRVFLAEVVAIDTKRRKVVLQDGEVEYDYLILATGAGHSYFGHPEWETYAPGLKSIEDALEIRRRILLAFEMAERETDEERRRALLTFVIIGGGPTGVELAGAIAEIAYTVMVQDFRSIRPQDARIILVEAGTRILPFMPESLSLKAERALKRLGVEIVKNSPVTSVHQGMVMAGTQTIQAGTVLWAAGVEPSPVARSLGVPLDDVGRVPVNPDLSIPGHPEVFVIGDLAAFVDETGKLLPGLAAVAVQQGRHVARNILRMCNGLPSEPFHYVDLGTMATIGRAAAVVNFNWIMLSGFLAWVIWIFVHILLLIGFRNRFVVLFDWAWSYLSFQRSARLITGGWEK
ncbi:MAG: NAD(P)/FAD-dependent oxidoreductase [Nitrospirae bacterium]|nr:MAG: NAD(P)/FAD-dependent oxidoreductase [Nitrospirota bacterium]